MEHKILYGSSVSAELIESVKKRRSLWCASCEILEISGGFPLESAGANKFLKQQKFSSLCINGFFDPVLSRCIALENSAVLRNEFKQKLLSYIELFGNCGVGSVVLDFDLDAVLKHEEYRNNLHEILFAAYHAAHFKRIKMLLKVYLPLDESNGNNKVQDYIDFYKRLMFSGVGFSLDLPIHDLLEHHKDPQDLLKEWRFFADQVRLTYDVDQGNTINIKQLKCFVDALKDFELTNGLIIAPRTSSREKLDSEISSLQVLIGSLNNSNNKAKFTSLHK